MSILKDIAGELKRTFITGTTFGEVRASINESISVSDERFWTNAFPKSITGKTVNTSTSLQIAAVFSCVRLLSETIGSLPLFVYLRRNDGGREPARNTELHSLLHDLPNPEMTAMNMRETLMAYLLLKGNAYAEIIRDRGGRVRELWLLKSENVEPFRETPDSMLQYRVTKDGEKRVLPKSRVWHIPGLGFDGIQGVNPLTYARETFGLSMAQSEYGSHVFANGMRFSGVITHPGKLGNETRQNLEQSISERWGGYQKAGGVPVFEEGMTFKEVSMTNEDAEFLKSRQFSIQEIARIFRVPLHMLYFSETQPRANMEQASLEFVVYSLLPWLKRIEQSAFRDLLSRNERTVFFIEHSVEGLLRGDFKSRMEGYSIAKQWGWMSSDEIRQKENMNPIPDGEGSKYWRPANMLPVGEEVTANEE